MQGRHVWHSFVVIAAVLAGCGDNIVPDVDTNNPPVLEAFSITTQEDTPVTSPIPATDPDEDPLTFLLGTPMHGTVTNDGTQLTYTPAADYVGTDAFDVVVSDGVASVTAVVSVTITAVNDAPVAADDSFATPEDTALTLSSAQILSNDTDPDGDTLTITNVSGVTNGLVATSGGTVVFTPAANFVGTGMFTYTVSDGTATDTATVTINIGGQNDAPVASNDTATTDEDTALTVTAATLLANDTDPDGQTVTVSAVGNATNGTVVLSGSNVTFTPAANFNGAATFEYTASDGALTDTAVVNVTVNAVNDAPVAADDSATTNEDAAVTLTAAALLGNDTDVDGDTLTVTGVSNAQNGSVALSGTDITFTPAANFVGTATFDYAISDGNGGTDVGTVSIAVGGVNDAPVAVDDSANATEDTTATIAASSLLGNDTDPDGDTLAITAVSGATNGTVSLSGTTITFTPTSNFNGTATFQYTVSDGNGGSDTAVVTLTVAAVNDAPNAVNDSLLGDEDVVATILTSAVLGNDLDIDGDTLSVTGVANAMNGSVSLSGTTITFTPAAGFSGTASFEYTASDGNGGTDTAVVTITIGAVNDPPVANPDTRLTDEDVTAVITAATLLSNDTDPEGNTLTITGVSNAMNGSVNLSGTTITFTPTSNFVGSASFEYSVSDGNGGTDTGLVTVTVGPVNDPPTAVDDMGFTGNEDFALLIVSSSLTVNDLDIDGDALVVTAVSNPTNGTVSLVGTTITFTPTANFNGTGTFEYTVSDGNGGTDTGLVSVVINAVNDNPIANGDSVTVPAGSSTNITIASLMTNDSDPEGSTLTFVNVSNASNGSVSADATNVTFTPDPGFVGSAGFSYTISDGSLQATANVIVTVTSTCGDGFTTLGEGCDDDDTDPGDGCSATCQEELGYDCTGQPSVCSTVCGDGIVAGVEACDDNGLMPGDGCSATCQEEPGFDCTGEPSVCVTVCGDGIPTFDEECDDGDPDNTDGCTTECVTGAICDATTHPLGDRFAVDPFSGHCFVAYDDELWMQSVSQAQCALEGGYLPTITSSGEQAVVTSIHGPLQSPWIGGTDLAVEGSFDWITGEAFTYTNHAPGQPDGDGDCLHLVDAQGRWNDTSCSVIGFVVGRMCEFEPEPCGDGVVEAGETCDDGNTTSGDGCSASCLIESGAVCSGAGPTLCSKLVINEVDYDQNGTDNSGTDFEFVEIRNVGTGPADVTNIALVLINGGIASPAEYMFNGTAAAANRLLLANAGVPLNQLPAGGFIVAVPVDFATSIPPTAFVLSFTAPAAGFVQNGGTDAVGLFDLSSNTIVDALSYEGSVAAATLSSIGGTYLFVEGSGHPSGDTGLLVSQSLSRLGVDTNDNATDFTLGVATPGLPNL